MVRVDAQFFEQCDVASSKSVMAALLGATPFELEVSLLLEKHPFMRVETKN